MPTNAKQFILDIERFSKSILPAEFVRFQKELAKTVFEEVIRRTPVRSGLLQSNWILSIGSPDGSKVEIRGKLGTLSDELSKLASLIPFQTIWIQNNQEYASFVEFGTKTNEPRMMLTIAIQKGKFFTITRGPVAA